MTCEFTGSLSSHWLSYSDVRANVTPSCESVAAAPPLWGHKRWKGETAGGQSATCRCHLPWRSQKLPQIPTANCQLHLVNQHCHCYFFSSENVPSTGSQWLCCAQMFRCEEHIHNHTNTDSWLNTMMSPCLSAQRLIEPRNVVPSLLIVLLFTG